MFRTSCRIAVVAMTFPLMGLTAATARADALTDLNDAFRRAYADTRTGMLAANGPIIVCAFESLVLIDGGVRREEGFTPRLYHDLKAVAHLVFAVQLLLDPRYDAGPLSAAARARLEELAQRARAVEAGLDGFGFTPVQRERQRALIAGALAMIERALASGRPPQEAFSAWLAGLVPAVMANVEDAAAAQLDGMHALATRWRSQLGPEKWSRLNVVVLGVRQARRDNLQFAYFVRLLGTDAVDRRLIYAESVFSVDPALSLLGTILTDRVAGTAFFGDPLRMERDLLADAAARRIAQLFGN